MVLVGLNLSKDTFQPSPFSLTSKSFKRIVFKSKRDFFSERKNLSCSGLSEPEYIKNSRKKKKRHSLLVANLPLNHPALLDEKMKQGMVMRREKTNARKSDRREERAIGNKRSALGSSEKAKNGEVEAG